MDNPVDDLIRESLAGLSLRESPELPPASAAVSSVSYNTHGIDKRGLQEAVKYGRKVRANRGRDGKTRWRYTHKGVVYITDETSRHEITSWRLADALEEVPRPLGGAAAAGSGVAHVVVIVDHSGSMRKNDVPGYDSRTAAVYDCLARDLIEPQLRKAGVGRMEVSVIEMSDDATVVLERAAPDPKLLAFLKGRMSARAQSHGNYLPALDAALKLLAGDAGRSNQLFLVLLSDGGPSDHVGRSCAHGCRVWNAFYTRKGCGQWGLWDCPISPDECRDMVYKQVIEDCVARMWRMGDLLGRDRVFIGTVAFGPPNENYTVLARIAKALPRHSFQKLGLSAACLRTAFTSLTSSLTSLRTEAAAPRRGGGGGRSSSLTLRTDITDKVERQAYEERETIGNGLVWELYCGGNLVLKRRYDAATKCMTIEPFTSSEPVATWRREIPDMQEGVAHATKAFAQGSERVVYQFTEVVSFDEGSTGVCVGPRLVAKSSVYAEDLDSPEFHLQFCKNQAEAEDLALLFNRRLQGGPEWQVHFLPCFLYTIRDGGRYSRTGQLQILVEQELEGKFIKWNNNAGGVTQAPLVPAAASAAVADTRSNDAHLLAVIAEDDENENQGRDSKVDDHRQYGSECNGGLGGRATEPALAEHVPQCFSHFTYSVTDGQRLVCDLQGVWNPVDGFTLTDPVIHHKGKSKRSTRATDKGKRGIESFFSTHVCNPLCRRLGLEPGPVRPK